MQRGLTKLNETLLLMLLLPMFFFRLFSLLFSCCFYSSLYTSTDNKCRSRALKAELINHHTIAKEVVSE